MGFVIAHARHMNSENQWSTKETLCLVSSILRFGTDDWYDND